MQALNIQAIRRLYQVSRDYYAPALATFTTRWLDTLAYEPDSFAVCLARDGIASFAAARTLMRMHPRRFRHVHQKRVRLAYISRILAQGAVADSKQAFLLERYLHAQGVTRKCPLLLVDVGIHGSIQDCIQKLYRDRDVRGQYLVLRRRRDDPNGMCKEGFFADLDVAPPALFSVVPSSQLDPGWEVGGALRGGYTLFLRPRSIHILEDFWNGAGETAERFQTTKDGEVSVVRRKPTLSFTGLQEKESYQKIRIFLKRAALRGVVDGVAQIREPATQGSDAISELAGWLEQLKNPNPTDAYLLRVLLRKDRHGYELDDFDT